MSKKISFREVNRWFIESLPYDVFWISREGQVVFANASFCSSLGYSKSEMEGLTMYDINPGLTAEKWERHWEIVRQKEVDHFRTTHRKKEGTDYLVEVFSLFFSNNGKNLICAIVQDITRQKEQELWLQLSDEVINRAKDLIYLIDEEGHFVRFNDSVLRELGYSREEFSRMSIFDLDVNMTKALWRQHWAEILEKKSFTFERTSVRKDRTQMPVEVTVNHLMFNRQDLNCAIVRDITERKKKELVLVEAFQEIKQLKQQVEAENDYLQEEIKRDYHFQDIICKSPEYAKVLQQALQVAPTDTSVLVTGESGTGKELLARAIHEASRRKERPLIKVNCAALPKELIESELFGHKKGAFTGAIADKTGRFELADKGTLFLDEIGELPLELQPKLLRVLQEGEFDRLGDTATTRVDVRIIAATNRRLEQMVRSGAFREDLYYRLNVFPIHSIPLRERREDIPLLSQYFLEKYAAKAGKTFRGISRKVLDAFMQYSFPGNIRELENLIERAVILENGPTLSPGPWMPADDPGSATQSNIPTLEEIQREHITKALFHTQWRVSGKKGAARILGVKDKTLFAKMAKLGIRKEDFLKR